MGLLDRKPARNQNRTTHTEPDPTPCREHVRVFQAPRDAEQCRLSWLQRNPIRS